MDKSNNDVTLAELNRNFVAHLESDDRFKADMTRDITLIKENHLAHMELDLSKVQTNVEWLLKYHWIIATASIGALIAGIISIVKH